MQSSSLKVLASSQKNSASSSRSCSSDDIFPSTARSSDSAFYTYTHTRSRSVNNMPHTHTHLFNDHLSGTTRVGRYQKGKTNLDFTEAKDSERQWHQLGHMQVCTSLQTDNHASTPPLSFLQAGCPSCRPTNSVKALKACYKHHRHNHHHCRVAGDGRRVVAPPCPRSTARTPPEVPNGTGGIVSELVDQVGDAITVRRSVE